MVWESLFIFSRGHCQRTEHMYAECPLAKRRLVESKEVLPWELSVRNVVEEKKLHALYAWEAGEIRGTQTRSVQSVSEKERLNAFIVSEPEKFRDTCLPTDRGKRLCEECIKRNTKNRKRRMWDYDTYECE